MKANKNRLYGHEFEMIDHILEEEERKNAKLKKIKNAKRKRKEE